MTFIFRGNLSWLLKNFSTVKENCRKLLYNNNYLRGWIKRRRRIVKHVDRISANNSPVIVHTTVSANCPKEPLRTHLRQRIIN